MVGYEFTVEEDETLIRLWLGGAQYDRIAWEMGKPLWQIKDRALKLGMPAHTLYDDEMSWTEDEDDALFATVTKLYPKSGFWHRVSDKIGTRSAKACEKRAKLIGAFNLMGISPADYRTAASMLVEKKSVREISVQLGTSVATAYILCGRIMELKLRGKELPV